MTWVTDALLRTPTRNFTLRALLKEGIFPHRSAASERASWCRFFYLALSLVLMWAMTPQLRVQVVDNEIVVTVPGFRYFATYCKGYNARQLVARNVPTTDDLRITMKKSEFLVAAKKLANDKARELGWIV